MQSPYLPASERTAAGVARAAILLSNRRVSHAASVRCSVRNGTGFHARVFHPMHFGIMQFEYDPEQLIIEVSKRPAIWNYDDPQYRQKHLKSKQWHEIVKVLVSINETTMTKSQMRELGNYIFINLNCKVREISLPQCLLKLQCR